MIGRSGGRSRDSKSSPRSRKSRPQVEGLESRLLLYSTLGAGWSYGNRITYSLVPDGTSIGGAPSKLFQTMEQRISANDAVWQVQFLKAAAVWQAVANINLVWVADDGRALGAAGNQQGDPGIGDIRISAIPLSAGTLGAAYSPPPLNGGTAAGDIVLNSTTAWAINSGFDLETVAIHEFGHALAMNHSQITNAVMYAYYNGIKQNLTSDDASGLQSVYGARRYDGLNSNGNNNAYYYWATPLNSLLDSNAQLTFSNLDITRAGQTEWFRVSAPSTTTGKLTVVAQAANLSLLSPRLTVYDANFNLLGESGAPNFGGTAWVPNIPTASGRGYYIQVTGYAGGSMVGGYALQVNFGSTPLGPVPVPYTTSAQQYTSTSSLSTMEAPRGKSNSNEHDVVKLGDFVGVGDDLTITDLGAGSWQAFARSTSSGLPSYASSSYTIGLAPLTVTTSRPATPSVPTRAVRSGATAAMKGLDRASVAWALQALPPTVLVGRSRAWEAMRS